VAGIAYSSLEAVAAARVSGYRYGHDFISDLGMPDSPLSPLMNTAFVVQGVLFLAGATLLVRARGQRPGVFTYCAAANAVGNVVVAAVPSGTEGIAWLHVSAAVLAIVGGNGAILAGWRLTSGLRAYRAASVCLATLGLLGFAMLAAAATTSLTMILPSATWERTSVYTIIVWQVLSSLLLLRPGGAVRRQ
jgi:hypothetical membrane protein